MFYRSEEYNLHVHEEGKNLKTFISSEWFYNHVVMIKLEKEDTKDFSDFVLNDVSDNFIKMFPNTKPIRGKSLVELFGKKNAFRLWLKIQKSVEKNQKMSFRMTLEDENQTKEYLVNIMPELRVDKEKLKIMILVEENNAFVLNHCGSSCLDFIHTYESVILEMSHSKDFNQFVSFLSKEKWLKKAWAFSCQENSKGELEKLNLLVSINGDSDEVNKVKNAINLSERIQNDIFDEQYINKMNPSIKTYFLDHPKMEACVCYSDQILPVLVVYELSDDMLNKQFLCQLIKDLLLFLIMQIDRLIAIEKTKNHQMLLDTTLKNMGISLWTIDVLSFKFKSNNYPDMDTKALIDEVVHPKDQSRAYKCFDDLISGFKKQVEMNIRIKKHCDKEYRWITCKAVLLDDSKKILMHRICGVNIDIHERVMNKSKRDYDLKHDTMTGLYNRAYIEKIMDRSIAKYPDKKYIAFYIDINNFKRVNDLYGYQKGDEYLVEIANIIKSSVPNGFFAGRFSGDEFFIFGERTTTLEKTYDLLNNIKETLLNQFYLLGISASIGVVRYPDDAKTSRDMIVFSDIAMYQAREKGNNIIHYFDSSYATDYLIDFIKLKEVRQGLRNREFILHYQPVIDYEAKKVISVEALARWSHPKKGLIYPNEFIELVELSGDIVILGEQVIDQAIEQLKRWSNTEKEDIYISVNLSHRQMDKPRFAQEIIKKLISNNIAPSRLCFEMTETAFVRSSKLYYENFKALKDFGCAMAMDDFGMEYSSLSKLQDIPFDILKIDRHFTQTIEDNPISIAIIELIVKIITVLNKKAIVEGVENENQLDIIQRLGLKNIQGYYFSKPLPVDQVEKFIEKYS